MPVLAVDVPPMWDWQRDEVAANALDPKRAIFCAPRTGKTRVAIESLKNWHAADYQGAPPRHTLVSCPLVVGPQWTEQLEAHGFGVFEAYRYSTARVNAYLTARPLDEVIVINDDKLAACEAALKKWSVDAFIFDESHRMRGVSAKRARAARRIAWKASWVRLLTGTPAPNHYGDLWGQLAAIDPLLWGSAYGHFAEKYLIREPMFDKVIGHRNVEELQANLLRCATIKRRDDIFGPDSWQIVTRKVALPESVMRQYRELADRWVLSDPDISTGNILTRLLRLQQITSGYLPVDAQAPYENDNLVNTGDLGFTQLHTAKEDAVIGDLEEIVFSREKAVVFHRFRREGARLFERIEAEYPKAYTDRIYGDTPTAERAAIVKDFANHRGPAVVVVQTQSGGVGISFAEATHALFASCDFNFADHEQARDRIYKPSHSRCVTYYTVPGTIDTYILYCLRQKRRIHESVTRADLESMVNGRME